MRNRTSPAHAFEPTWHYRANPGWVSQGPPPALLPLLATTPDDSEAFNHHGMGFQSGSIFSMVLVRVFQRAFLFS